MGQFYFAGAPAQPPLAPTGPDPEAVMWALVEQSTVLADGQAFLEAYPNGRFTPAARLKLQQLQRVANQRGETQPHDTEQERQRRDREAAEAQRQAEEHQRLEAVKRQEEEKQKEQQRLELLEPKSKLGERQAVAVPAATINGKDWSRNVPAFRIDLKPVCNREFLEFVQANPQWKKSRIASNLHDGNYLKYWDGDEAMKSRDMNSPVRYVSYYAAVAYCSALHRKLPTLEHYRAATGRSEEDTDIRHDIPYKVPDFNLVSTEWTDSSWSASAVSEKRVLYQYGTTHSAVQSSRNYTTEEEKRHTGKSLGFRCAEH